MGKLLTSSLGYLLLIEINELVDHSFLFLSIYKAHLYFHAQMANNQQASYIVRFHSSTDRLWRDRMKIDWASMVQHSRDFHMQLSVSLLADRDYSNQNRSVLLSCFWLWEYFKVWCLYALLLANVDTKQY